MADVGRGAPQADEQLTERYGAAVAVGVLLSMRRATDSVRVGIAGAMGVGGFLLAPERREALACGLCQALRACTKSAESLRCGLCRAIAKAGKAGPLPLPLGESVVASDDTAAATVDATASTPTPTSSSMVVDGDDQPPATRTAVVQELVRVLEDKHSKGRAAAELAATALGQLCLGDRSPEIVDACRHALLRTPDTLAATGDSAYESHFVIGRALVGVAAAHDTTDVPGKLDADEASAPVAGTATAVESDVTAELASVIFARCGDMDGNGKQRRAAVVWLFCIVEALGATHPAVQQRLVDAQQIFMNALGDRSDLIQDIASRGVAVVYERSDATTRATLIKSLVGGLSSEKVAKPTAQTTEGGEEREIFADGGSEGALGKAPNGSGTRTYKELCSLVNDLGQPDLIYKFMGLAAHGQMLNTQAGFSLGLGAIAAKAQEQLEPHLPALIPKLYRYQFEPTPKVQQSMKSMWQALVPDTKVALSTYFEAIVTELLPAMGERQWRIRESSAAALAEIISGRPPALVRPHLTEMWRMVLRAMDDIKESVRSAAQRAGRTLASLSTKMCEHGSASPSDGPAVCAIVLPLLLKQGLHADAEEVRAFAIKNLIRVAKAAGPWLGPHIAEMAPAMLEALSLMESAMLNYAQFHVSDKETLESMRATASATGPCAEVLDLCIKHADEPSIAQLAPSAACSAVVGVVGVVGGVGGVGG